ncbi:hypothetical protein JTA33_00470 [Pseudomonas sp. 20GA0080]|uniref:hypothetical protein n=1 Tax=Pseudomonas alliivorans TaxID=2810613 RepID=UPI001AE4CB36|nr:hypothetical protein [Pseudomonas alliivorans]MBP0948921.1 hypothetical protein [Pseudomonas alliivorans]
MSKSEFNLMMSVLWLIAAGVQSEIWFELACTIFFVVHGLKSLYWVFVESRAVKP